MTTSSDDSILRDFNSPELEPGDLIFFWGRFTADGWTFLGIPKTNLGVSYYFVTGEEDQAQRGRLVALVS